MRQALWWDPQHKTGPEFADRNGFMVDADGYLRWVGYGVRTLNFTQRKIDARDWQWVPIMPGDPEGWQIPGCETTIPGSGNVEAVRVTPDASGYVTLNDGRKFWLGADNELTLYKALEDGEAHGEQSDYARVRPYVSQAEPIGPAPGPEWVWDGFFWALDHPASKYRLGSVIGAPRWCHILHIGRVRPQELYPEYADYYQFVLDQAWPRLRPTEIERDDRWPEAPRQWPARTLDFGPERPAPEEVPDARAAAVWSAQYVISGAGLNIRTKPAVGAPIVRKADHGEMLRVDPSQTHQGPSYDWVRTQEGWVASMFLGLGEPASIDALNGERPVPDDLRREAARVGLGHRARWLWAICLAESNGRTRLLNGRRLVEGGYNASLRDKAYRKHEGLAPDEPVPPPDRDEYLYWVGLGAGCVQGWFHREFGCATPTAMHAWMSQDVRNEFSALCRYFTFETKKLARRALEERNLEALVVNYNGALDESWMRRFREALKRIPEEREPTHRNVVRKLKCKLEVQPEDGQIKAAAKGAGNLAVRGTAGVGVMAAIAAAAHVALDGVVGVDAVNALLTVLAALMTVPAAGPIDAPPAPPPTPVVREATAIALPTPTAANPDADASVSAVLAPGYRIRACPREACEILYQVRLDPAQVEVTGAAGEWREVRLMVEGARLEGWSHRAGLAEPE